MYMQLELAKMKCITIVSLFVLIFVLSVRSEENKIEGEDDLSELGQNEDSYLQEDEGELFHPHKPRPSHHPRPSRGPRPSRRPRPTRHPLMGCFVDMIKCFRSGGKECIGDFKECATEHISPQVEACLTDLRRCVKGPGHGGFKARRCFRRFKRCMRKRPTQKPGPGSGSGSGSGLEPEEF